MKSLVKIGLLAIMIGIFASGCSGCGDRAKPAPEGTSKVNPDSPRKAIDTMQAKIDSAKKDTSKK